MPIGHKAVLPEHQVLAEFLVGHATSSGGEALLPHLHASAAGCLRPRQALLQLAGECCTLVCAFKNSPLRFIDVWSPFQQCSVFCAAV